MTPKEFCYWLQGYFELTNHTDLTQDQVRIVKDHLAIVFNQEPKLLSDAKPFISFPEIPASC